MGPEHRLEIFSRNRLVIVGAIRSGRGVAHTANVLGQAVNHIVGHILGLAAQDMLEQVRKSAAPLGIVLGSDFIPQRSRHIGGARIGNCDHRQAVIEHPARVFDPGRRKLLRIARLFVMIGQHRARDESGYGAGTGQQDLADHGIPQSIDSMRSLKPFASPASTPTAGFACQWSRIIDVLRGSVVRGASARVHPPRWEQRHGRDGRQQPSCRRCRSLRVRPPPPRSSPRLPAQNAPSA